MLKKDIWNRLTGFILNNHRAIVLFFILIVILGIYSALNLHIAFMPERADHVVTIVTEYPDTETGRIINLITKPLEKALKNVKGVRDIYSFSSRGRSKILCHFNPHENIDEFVVRLTDSIYQVAKGFPNEVHHPMVFRYNTDDSPLMMVSIQQEYSGFDNAVDFADEFNNLIKNRIKPELLSIEGVADVQVSGLDTYENLVKIRHEALDNLKVNYLDLLQYLLKNNYNSPPGKFVINDREIPVSISGRYSSVMEMKKGKVRLDKAFIFSRDLLDIVRIKRPAQRFSMVNGRDAVVLFVYKKSGSSIMEIDSRVSKRLNAFSDELSWQKLYSEAYDLRNLLGRMVISLTISFILLSVFFILLYRKVSVFIIVLFFSLIVSCFGSLLTIFVLGLDLNIISLAGIIIGEEFTLIYGIIFLENLKNGCCIDKRLYSVKVFGIENSFKKKTGISVLALAFENAFYSSARPIISTSFIVTFVFFPLFFVSKSLGSEIWIIPYKDFALTLSVALWWSVIALFLFVPSFLILTDRKKNIIFKMAGVTNITEKRLDSGIGNKEEKVIGRKSLFLIYALVKTLAGFWSNVIEYTRQNNLKKMHLNSLDENHLIKGKYTAQKIDGQKALRKKFGNLFIMKHGFILVLYLVFSLVLLLIFLCLFYQMDYREVTLLKKNYREFYYQFNAGFTHDYKVNATKEIVKKILLSDFKPPAGSYKGITSVEKNRTFLVTTLNGDRASFRLFNYNNSILKIAKLRMMRKYRVRFTYPLNPGKKVVRKDGFFYSGINPYLEKRINDTLSLRILIFGYDVKSVNRLADSSSKMISAIPGVRQILKGYREGVNELSIIPDTAKLYFYNLNYASAERFLRYLFYKPVVFKFYNGKLLEDVRASVTVDDRKQKTGNIRKYIQNLKIPAGEGNGFIRIRDFARVYSGKASSDITRKNGKPYISLEVRYSNSGNNVVSSIRSIMSRQPFKLGEYFIIDEDALTERNIRCTILLSILLSIFLLWIIMSIVLKSFMLSSLSILPVPVVIAGLILFLKISGFSNSVSSVISILVLFGLSICFNLLIIGAVFFVNTSETSFLKLERRTIFKLQKEKLDNNRVIINSFKIILLSFVANFLLLMPIFYFAGINNFYRVLIGAILFSIFIVIVFLLAIFPLICIIIKRY